MKPRLLTAALSSAFLTLTLLLALSARSQDVNADLQRAVDGRDWRAAIAIIDRAIAENPKAPNIKELRAYRKQLESLLKQEPSPPASIPTRAKPGSNLPTLKVPVSKIASYNESTWCQSTNTRSKQKPFGITQARVHVDPNAAVIKERLIGCLTNNSTASNYMLDISCFAQPGHFMTGVFGGPQPGRTVFFSIPFTTKIAQVEGCDLSVGLTIEDQGTKVQRWVFKAI